MPRYTIPEINTFFETNAYIMVNRILREVFMPDRGLHVQQTENVDRGRLQVNVTSTLGLQPVVNARVSIAYTGKGSEH